MDIGKLQEKVLGIHGHDINTVAVWDAAECPFCGGWGTKLDFLNTGVFQCRANFKHVGWLGDGYVKVVDFTDVDTYPVALATEIKLMEVEDWKAWQNPEGIVFKPPMPGSDPKMPLWVKVKPDEVVSVNKWVYTPKVDGVNPLLSMTNPCMEVQLPLPVEKITVTMTMKFEAYPMPLLNPKSNWGKRMKEKLEGKS